MYTIRLYFSELNLKKQKLNYLSSLKTPLSPDTRNTLGYVKVKNKHLLNK